MCCTVLKHTRYGFRMAILISEFGSKENAILKT